jgi:hypothetical protein
LHGPPIGNGGWQVSSWELQINGSHSESELHGCPGLPAEPPEPPELVPAVPPTPPVATPAVPPEPLLPPLEVPPLPPFEVPPLPAVPAAAPESAPK